MKVLDRGEYLLSRSWDLVGWIAVDSVGTRAASSERSFVFIPPSPRRLAREALQDNRMIPQLPTEVTSHIIQLSLPHPSFDSLGERADLLLSYSLVSRIWRALAQRELFKHAVIKNRQAAGGFTAALEEAGAGLRERVTSLRFGSGSNDLDAPEFDRWVVLELTSLVELWVLGVRNLKLSSVAGSGRESLAIDSVTRCRPR